MHVSDWQAFCSDIPWFLKPNQTVRVGTTHAPRMGLFKPSSAFRGRFPRLTELLSMARTTEVWVDDQQYHLYGWTGKESSSFGWVCLPPLPVVDRTDLHPDHQLLLRCFGGITERWNEPEDGTWLSNLNSALTSDTSVEGWKGWDSYLREVCEDEGMPVPKFKPTDYVSFAFEANGNLTMYHRETGQVLMMAHDHSFENVSVLAGCPPSTLYTIDDCPDFKSWVEIVAGQWLAVMVGV